MSQTKTNTTWYHLYVEFKTNKRTNKKLIEIENRKVVARGLEYGGNRERLAKSTNFPLKDE